jgi:hypothetical protein
MESLADTDNAFSANYRMVGNFHVVVIFVVDLVIKKFPRAHDS